MRQNYQDLAKQNLDMDNRYLEVVGFEDVDESDLETQLKKAIDSEDYLKAAEIRNKRSNKKK